MWTNINDSDSERQKENLNYDWYSPIGNRDYVFHLIGADVVIKNKED